MLCLCTHKYNNYVCAQEEETARTSEIAYFRIYHGRLVALLNKRRVSLQFLRNCHLCKTNKDWKLFIYYSATETSRLYLMPFFKKIHCPKVDSLQVTSKGTSETHLKSWYADTRHLCCSILCYFLCTVTSGLSVKAQLPPAKLGSHAVLWQREEQQITSSRTWDRQLASFKFHSAIKITAQTPALFQLN